MTNRIRSITLILIVLLAGPVAAVAPEDSEPSLRESAERFFRGVYGCNARVINELASEDVVVSYPVFQTVFGKPALRGRVAVRAFAERFCKKWADAEFQFHDAVADRHRVVLVWSFSARPTDHEATFQRSSWGGISLFRFDSHGKITHEMGEESEPGPIGRLEQAGAD